MYARDIDRIVPEGSNLDLWAHELSDQMAAAPTACLGSVGTGATASTPVGCASSVGTAGSS